MYKLILLSLFVISSFAMNMNIDNIDVNGIQKLHDNVYQIDGNIFEVGNKIVIRGECNPFDIEERYGITYGESDDRDYVHIFYVDDQDNPFEKAKEIKSENMNPLFIVDLEVNRVDKEYSKTYKRSLIEDIYENLKCDEECKKEREKKKKEKEKLKDPYANKTQYKKDGNILEYPPLGAALYDLIERRAYVADDGRIPINKGLMSYYKFYESRFPKGYSSFNARIAYNRYIHDNSLKNINKLKLTFDNYEDFIKEYNLIFKNYKSLYIYNYIDNRGDIKHVFNVKTDGMSIISSPKENYGRYETLQTYVDGPAKVDVDCDIKEAINMGYREYILSNWGGMRDFAVVSGLMRSYKFNGKVVDVSYEKLTPVIVPKNPSSWDSVPSNMNNIDVFLNELIRKAKAHRIVFLDYIFVEKYGNEDKFIEIIDQLSENGYRGLGNIFITHIGVNGDDKNFNRVSLPKKMVAVGSVLLNGKRLNSSNYGSYLDFVVPVINSYKWKDLYEYKKVKRGYGTSDIFILVNILQMMLEANPDLTRDQIVEILVKTAKRDVLPYSFKSNDSRNKNEFSQYPWNYEVGYGLIDADDAIKEAVKLKKGIDNLTNSAYKPVTNRYKDIKKMVKTNKMYSAFGNVFVGFVDGYVVIPPSHLGHFKTTMKDIIKNTGGTIYLTDEKRASILADIVARSASGWFVRKHVVGIYSVFNRVFDFIYTHNKATREGGYMMLNEKFLFSPLSPTDYQTCKDDRYMNVKTCLCYGRGCEVYSFFAYPHYENTVQISYHQLYIKRGDEFIDIYTNKDLDPVNLDENLLKRYEYIMEENGIKFIDRVKNF